MIFRALGISREGFVSLAWATDDNMKDMELRSWPLHWRGIYRFLMLHVLGGDRNTGTLPNILREDDFVGIIAFIGEIWRHTRLTLVQEDISDRNGNGCVFRRPILTFQGRHKLLEYVALMTKYTLQMSSDDCGGATDYIEFFNHCRNVRLQYSSQN